MDKQQIKFVKSHWLKEMKRIITCKIASMQDAISSRKGINAERKQLENMFDELQIKYHSLDANSSQEDKHAEAHKGAHKLLHDISDNPISSDLVIKVGQQSIYVNKSVLRMYSSYFRYLDQFITYEDNQAVIRLDEFSYATVYAYFKYIYTGKIDLESMDKKFELLIMAEKFMETKLRTCCHKIIRKEITEKNAISVYKLAKKYNKKIVQSYCSPFLIKSRTL